MNIEAPVKSRDSELGIIPLVNVVFLVLIFLVLVGKFTAPEPLDIRPPVSVSGAKNPRGLAKILLTRDGQVAVDGVVTARSQLSERVSGVLSARPDVRFQLKADARLEAVRMIEVMEELRDAGVERLTLLTQLVPP